MTAVEAEAWQKIKKWPYSGREDKTVNHLLDTNAGDTVPLRIVIKETSSPDMVARLEHGTAGTRDGWNTGRLEHGTAGTRDGWNMVNHWLRSWSMHQQQHQET